MEHPPSVDSCKGEAVRKGCPSRWAFGSIGRSDRGVGVLFGGDRVSWKREAVGFLETGSRSLGNEGLLLETGVCRSGSRGSLERGIGRSSDLRVWWRVTWAGRLGILGQWKRCFGARLGSGSFGIRVRSGVREPREGDDFGWSFLGVFRVLASAELGGGGRAE